MLWFHPFKDRLLTSDIRLVREQILATLNFIDEFPKRLLTIEVMTTTDQVIKGLHE